MKISVVVIILILPVALIVLPFFSGRVFNGNNNRLQRSTHLNIVPGIGVKEVCECGMDLKQALKNIEPYDSFDFKSFTSYVKFEWGLSVDIPREENARTVRSLCFHVLPVCWVPTIGGKLLPDFTNEHNLFRGTIEGGLDFSCVLVSPSEVFEKIGSVEMVLVQGNSIVDVAKRLDSYAITAPNGDYVAVGYNHLGITFTFSSNYVESIYITEPLTKQTQP